MNPKKGEIEEDGSPYWGAGEKKHWLSLWHATVEILGDPTVGGGNANSNLQPYTSKPHATTSPRLDKKIHPCL